MTDKNEIIYNVPDMCEGMRLDKYLASETDLLEKNDLSRARIQSLLEGGAILLNGKPSKASYKIKIQDIISVSIPAPQEAEPQPVNLPLNILFEDDDVIVINKAAGMTVHPAAGHYDDTLVNALLFHCKDSLSGIGGVLRPGIVHRIDKDTSGVMVVAKNDQAHHHLSNQFAEHSIQRRYHAVCFGSPNTKTGTIVGNIGRAPHQRQKMTVLKEGGKHATTHFEVINQKKIDNYIILSLIEFQLETGRTHQIRVHASHSGFPLVGDPIYGKGKPAFLKKLSDAERATLQKYPYQALHACILGFIHPKTEEYMEFKSDYNAPFTDLMNIF